jgi:uncharacterized protein YfdQ (DUF2303 family)
MDKNDTQAAIDAGMQLGSVRRTADKREFVVIPVDTRIESLDHLLPNPVRQRALVDLGEMDSFVLYLKTFSGATTRIFASIDVVRATALFTAILDYHEGKDGKAGWGEHRVNFRAAQTPEWMTWAGHNKKPMSQTAFAEFIEENIEEIVSPPGAQMLEIAKTLEAKTSVDFKSGIRLENGDHHLKYISETTGRAGGNGDIEIPSLFTVGLPPFQGGPAYKIGVRLRYRITEGHLSLWYELIASHKVVEAATREMVDVIKAETDQDAFVGAAPSLSVKG